jgi:hypothetical protein
MELDLIIRIARDADVVSGEQMLTLRAKTHLAKRPPLFERVSRLKELEFSSEGFWQRGHQTI